MCVVDSWASTAFFSVPPHVKIRSFFLTPCVLSDTASCQATRLDPSCTICSIAFCMGVRDSCFHFSCTTPLTIHTPSRVTVFSLSLGRILACSGVLLIAPTNPVLDLVCDSASPHWIQKKHVIPSFAIYDLHVE